MCGQQVIGLYQINGWFGYKQYYKCKGIEYGFENWYCQCVVDQVVQKCDVKGVFDCGYCVCFVVMFELIVQ